MTGAGNRAGNEAENGAKNGPGNGARNGANNGSENGVADSAGSQAFEVWRQDDNGNRFLVSRHPDRAAAEAAVSAMEAGVQHKQLYYVIRGSSSG